MYGRTEMLSNSRMPKQIVTARMEGIRKRGESRKRWTIEAEEDLKTRGLKVMCIGQRTEEMEKECIKSQSSQNISALEKRKKKKKKMGTIMLKKK
jgi:hypothetical protein